MGNTITDNHRVRIMGSMHIIHNQRHPSRTMVMVMMSRSMPTKVLHSLLMEDMEMVNLVLIPHKLLLNQAMPNKLTLSHQHMVCLHRVLLKLMAHLDLVNREMYHIKIQHMDRMCQLSNHTRIQQEDKHNRLIHITLHLRLMGTVSLQLILHLLLFIVNRVVRLLLLMVILVVKWHLCIVKAGSLVVMGLTLLNQAMVSNRFPTMQRMVTKAPTQVTVLLHQLMVPHQLLRQIMFNQQQIHQLMSSSRHLNLVLTQVYLEVHQVTLRIYPHSQYMANMILLRCMVVNSNGLLVLTWTMPSCGRMVVQAGSYFDGKTKAQSEVSLGAGGPRLCRWQDKVLSVMMHLDSNIISSQPPQVFPKARLVMLYFEGASCSGPGGDVLPLLDATC